MRSQSLVRFPSRPEDVGGVFGEQFAPWAIVRKSIAPGVWGPAERVRTEHLQLSVTAPALHYGLNCFEGMKAYKNQEGGLHLFRVPMHAQRLRQSAERLCMQAPSDEDFAADCAAVTQSNADFVPAYGQGALYLRPLLLGSESYLGVRPSNEHLFVVLASPVKRIESSPIRVTISSEVTRAPKGGLGAAKTGANYAGGMKDALQAKEEGFGHVLFLDAETRSFVIEGLTSNILFVLEDRVVTPCLDDTILHGITRDTCLQLLREQGVVVEERPVPLRELQEWGERGLLKETILVGTAAVVTSVRSIRWDGGLVDIVGGGTCEMLRARYEAIAWKDAHVPEFRWPVDSVPPPSIQRPYDHASAWRWAQAWADEWNQADFDALAQRFAVDCAYLSPMAKKLSGNASLQGRDAVRDHWENAAASMPSMQFDVQQVVFDGAQLVIQYEARLAGQSGGRVSAEIFRLDPEGLVEQATSMVGA